MNVRHHFQLLTAALMLFSGVSCSTWKRHFGSDNEYSSASDSGGYNPYPGSSGTPSYQEYQPSQPSTPQQPQYQTYTPPQQPYTQPVSDYTPSPDYSEPAPKKKTPPKKKKTTTPAKSKAYTVKSGDTLYGIAKRNNTTVSKLKSKNGLSSDIIRPGQSLKL